VQDLSKLAENSIGVRAGSMAATNTVSVTPDFGAPGTGSESVNDNDFAEVQPVTADFSNNVPIKPGTDGKPQASGQQGYRQAPPAWKLTGAARKAG
jgi:hypothetical protein